MLPDGQNLREIKELVEENNTMLKKLRRGQVWGRVFTILYWVIIVGVAVGAFYFVQPYVNALQETQSSIGGIFDIFGGGEESVSTEE